MRGCLAIVLLAGAAGTAHADFFDHVDRMSFGAQLQYEASGWHDVEHATGVMTTPPADLALAGFRVHGHAGGRRLAYHIGLDMLGGGTAQRGGFAYDVTLFPLGIALQFFDTSYVSLGAGIGANGAVGTLDDAVTFPIEARFEMGRGVRMLGRVRATYLGGARGRKDGGVSSEIGDELEAMLGLRLGHAYHDWGMASGNGYFVGATAREALGARFVGLVIGYSVDMASAHRDPIPE